MPRGVVDFTFIRAPVKRIADVLSKGFPSGEHVYDLTPRWRVADCSRGVPFAHINGARREFPPAVEAHALHGACDAFEFYIDVSPYYDAAGRGSLVQLASFWRGNGGAGLDVNIMPDTCFEAFVFLEGVRSAGVFPAGALPVSFDFEGYVDVDERGIATSYNGVFDRLKARGVPIPVADAVLIDYERDAGRMAQACGCASRGLFPRLALSGIHQQGEEAEVLAGYAHGMERPELARAVCGTVRGAGLRKGASAQAVQDAWHR